MSVKRLVAKEVIVVDEVQTTYLEGYKYVLLVDPETGETYSPKPGWEVTGENLENLFDVDVSRDDTLVRNVIEGSIEWVEE